MLSMGKRGTQRINILFVWCSVITSFITLNISAQDTQNIKEIIDQSITQNVAKQNIARRR